MASRVFLAIVMFGWAAALSQAQQTTDSGLPHEATPSSVSGDTELPGLRTASLTEWESETPVLIDAREGLACDASLEDGAALYGGYSFVFMKPHLKESFKAFSIDLLTGTQDLIGFNHSYDLAPKVWLGMQGPEGLGVRARYWQYDQTASPLALVSTPTSIVAAQSVTVVFPGGIQSASPGQVLEVSNGLRMQTLDFEGTQSIDFGAVDGLLGVGLRYATLRQTYDAAISGAGFPQQTLSALREFEGVGPVISGEFRRPISRAGLSGFVGVGGGVFFGRKSMHREVNNLSGSFPPIVNMDDADEVTGMGELQFGLEWSRCTSLGQLFVRGDYGAQLWTDAGAPTLTFLGLEGFSLSLGVLH